MSEQNKALVDRARALLAAATPGPWGTGEHVGEPRALCVPPGGMESLLMIDRDGMAICASAADAAIIAAAPELLAALCDAAADAERRAEDALAEQTRHLLLTTVAGLKAQKAEAQSAAGRVAIRMLMDDHDPRTHSRCGDRECDHVRFAVSALGDDAGRAILDRLAAAESERDRALTAAETSIGHVEQLMHAATICAAERDALRAENARLRESNAMACENPNPRCECSGCWLARDENGGGP